MGNCPEVIACFGLFLVATERLCRDRPRNCSQAPRLSRPVRFDQLDAVSFLYPIGVQFNLLAHFAVEQRLRDGTQVADHALFGATR